MCEPGSGGTCSIKVFVIKVHTPTYHLTSETGTFHFIQSQGGELQTLVIKQCRCRPDCCIYTFCWHFSVQIFRIKRLQLISTWIAYRHGQSYFKQINYFVWIIENSCTWCKYRHNFIIVISKLDTGLHNRLKTDKK